MEQRALGRDGPQVPVLGFGAWPIGGGMGRVERNAAIAAVRAAVDSGITLVDTAEAYRTSEEIVGEALRGGYRERCFLATKASVDFSARGIRAAIEKSLRALRVEQVDLYQVHSWNPRYPIEKTMEEMRRLRDQGKTRFVGVSNFDAEQMALAAAVCPIQSNQVRYHLFSREIENRTVAWCQAHGVGILVHSPLAKGLLTGRYTPASVFPPEDERSTVYPEFSGALLAERLHTAEKLKQIAEEKGISLLQLAIAWTLRLPAVSCTLVGAKSAGQVKDHRGAVGVTFSGEELRRIDAALAG
jgi:aryl-alcohol dehydrogenase-like predicted oxidoreductase